MPRKALEIEVMSLLQILINQHFLNEDLEGESLFFKKVLKIIINYLKKKRLS